MKLNEYLAKNAVKLMIKGSGEKNPTRQTNDLGMYDYVENLESVLGKMVWICDYRANADPTKKPIRNIKPTPVVVTDAKETSKTIYYSPVYFCVRLTRLLHGNAICRCSFSMFRASTMVMQHSSARIIVTS